MAMYHLFSETPAEDLIVIVENNSLEDGFGRKIQTSNHFIALRAGTPTTDLRPPNHGHSDYQLLSLLIFDTYDQGKSKPVEKLDGEAIEALRVIWEQLKRPLAYKIVGQYVGPLELDEL